VCTSKQWTFASKISLSGADELGHIGRVVWLEDGNFDALLGEKAFKGPCMRITDDEKVGPSRTNPLPERGTKGHGKGWHA
jgi:hypothetical protein